jgi:hypothetical protein
MKRMKQTVFIGFGWALVAAGVVLAPLPGPGGVPAIAAGAYILIRNSSSARRTYVRAKRRWPGAIGPIDRIMRRRNRTTTGR